MVNLNKAARLIVACFGFSVTARKRKRGGRILLYMLGAMKAAIIYGLLHGVAALAGKAVLVAKIALAIAIVAILKKNGT